MLYKPLIPLKPRWEKCQVSEKDLHTNLSIMFLTKSLLLFLKSCKEMDSLLSEFERHADNTK